MPTTHAVSMPKKVATPTAWRAFAPGPVAKRRGSTPGRRFASRPPGGKRTGPDGHPTIRKLLAYSTGYIYWRIVTDPQELEAAGVTAKPKEERPPKPKSKLQEKYDRDLGPRPPMITSHPLFGQ